MIEIIIIYVDKEKTTFPVIQDKKIVKSRGLIEMLKRNLNISVHGRAVITCSLQKLCSGLYSEHGNLCFYPQPHTYIHWDSRRDTLK